MIDAGRIEEAAHELRPISSSVTRLIQEASSPDGDMEEITRSIQSDLGLMAVVLRVANSASYAGSVEVTDIRSAVVRLGMGAIISIATGHAYRENLSISVPEYGLSEEELWRHSLACSVAAECLQEYCEVKIPVEAATAALLHDIGKLVLRQFIDRDVARAISEYRENHEDAFFLEAERAVLGTTHCEVGTLVSRSWNLPASIIQGIEWHHSPDEEKSVISDIVHVTNLIAKTIGEGLGYEGLGLGISIDAADRLGFSPQGFEPLCSAVLFRYRDTLSSYHRQVE